MFSTSKPVIIAISGTHGVGKTTLAYNLSNRLNIRQRAGLGVIISTLRYSMRDNPIVERWGNYTQYKTPEHIIKKLHDESKLMGEVLTDLINKATVTGEPYIIDGVQLLPQYMPLEKVCFLTLHLKNSSEHMDRFMHPKITKKHHLTNADFKTVKILEAEILKSAKLAKVPVFESNIDEDRLTNNIISSLNLERIE